MLLSGLFRSFQYVRKTLAVIIPSDGFVLPGGGAPNERLVSGAATNAERLDVGKDEFAAFIDARNAYSEYYLLDLAIATKYTKAGVIAKGTFEQHSADGNAGRQYLGMPYSYGESYYIDAALVSSRHIRELLERVTAGERRSHIRVFDNPNDVFFVDQFGFLPENPPPGGASPIIDQRTGHHTLDAGIGIEELLRTRGDPLAPSCRSILMPKGFCTAVELSEILDIQSARSKGVECSVRGPHLLIDVEGGTASPYYIYTSALLSIDKVWPDGSGKLFLETTPGLELAPVVIFFDAQENRISHKIAMANWIRPQRFPPTRVLSASAFVWQADPLRRR